MSTAKELAAEINEFLKRFEADPVINAKREYANGSKLQPYWNAWASASGRFVRCTYVSYQGSAALTIAEAQIYLDALRAGFVGRHFEAIRRAKESQERANAAQVPNDSQRDMAAMTERVNDSASGAPKSVGGEE